MNIVFIRKAKNGDLIYQIRVIIGKYPNGTPKRWTKNISAKSEQGAWKKAMHMKRAGEIPEDYSGSTADFQPVTLREFIQIWREEHYASLAPRTCSGYDSILNTYILDFLGSRPVDKLDENDIRRFLRYLTTSRDHHTKSHHLSATMIHKCYRLLSELLEAAADKKFIPENPCNRISKAEIPRPDYRATPIWQKKELAIFIQHLEEIPDTYHNFQKIVMLETFLLTGMRKGELSVLQWSDIDMSHKSIRVEKALKLMTSKELIIAEPKTQKSNREIFIDAHLLSLLETLWHRQKDYLAEIRQENPQDFIFITQRRQSREIIPVTPSYLYMWLRREAKACGLPHIDVHSLRHMAATYALAEGAPLSGVQNMMGHTSIRTTSIYLHLMEQQKQETVNALSAGLAALRKSDSDNSPK